MLNPLWGFSFLLSSPITCITLTQHGKKMLSTSHKMPSKAHCVRFKQSFTFCTTHDTTHESFTFCTTSAQITTSCLMIGGAHFLPMLSELNACDGRAFSSHVELKQIIYIVNRKCTSKLDRIIIRTCMSVWASLYTLQEINQLRVYLYNTVY